MTEDATAAKLVRAMSRIATLLSFAGAATLAFVVSFVSLGVMVAQSGGEFGPEVLVGWPNRIETLAYCVWLMTVAWQALKLRWQKS